MTIKRFSGSFRTRDDVFDNITPNNVVQFPSGGVSVPAGEWKPADYLPVVWQGSASKDYFTISSGKVVSMDVTGRIVPAGLRRAILDAAATTTEIISYDATDVEAGVKNMATGDAAASGDSVTIEDLVDNWVARGLLRPNTVTFTSGAAYDASESADVLELAREAISVPVGVCAYDVYSWAGDAPAELIHVNYQKQHLVQFFTDVQMQVPRMASADQLTSDALNGVSAWSETDGTDGSDFPSAVEAGAELFLNSAQLNGLARYEDSVGATSDIVGFAVESVRPAASTDRTPVENGTGDLLVAEKSSIANLKSEGDWFFDASVGVLLIMGADSTTNPAGAGDTITFYEYGTEGADADKHVHCDGTNVLPGDFVTYDANSNFVISLDSDGNRSTDSTDEECVGRVLQIIQQPKGLLERATTAFSGSSFDSTMQMPGTATKGFTDLITLSDEQVADSVVIINVKVQ